MEHPPTAALLVCVTPDKHQVRLHCDFFVIMNQFKLRIQIVGY